MANSFTGRLIFRVEANERFAAATVEAAGGSAIKYLMELGLDLRNGTTDGQIDLAYGTRVTGVAASTTTVYDLAGSLTDKSGSTITFAEVTTIAIRNLSSTAANYLTVGPDATNGFGVVASNKGFWADASDRNVVPANYDSSSNDGSWLILHSRGGVPVAAGSTDELAVITQGGTSANTWEIVIMGRSA